VHPVQHLDLLRAALVGLGQVADRYQGHRLALVVAGTGAGWGGRCLFGSAHGSSSPVAMRTRSPLPRSGGGSSTTVSPPSSPAVTSRSSPRLRPTCSTRRATLTLSPSRSPTTNATCSS